MTKDNCNKQSEGERIGAEKNKKKRCIWPGSTEPRNSFFLLPVWCIECVCLIRCECEVRLEIQFLAVSLTNGLPVLLLTFFVFPLRLRFLILQHHFFLSPFLFFSLPSFLVFLSFFSLHFPVPLFPRLFSVVLSVFINCFLRSICTPFLLTSLSSLTSLPPSLS